MAYFVYHKDYDLVGEFAFFDEEPDEYEPSDWRTGKKSKRNLPELTLTSDAKYTPKLSDVLLARIELELYSPKMVTTLQECGVQNIEYYPAVVVNHENGERIETYRAANIIGTIACLDVENSDVTYSTSSDKIIDVEEFSLLEDKIVATPDMDCEPLLFRLAEVDAIIIAHSIVVDHFEAAGITGIKFTDPQEYMGI